MSHDLTVRDDGTVEMFSAGGEPVWHRLGQRTETAVTSEAAMRMAALDWLVRAQPIDMVDPAGDHRRINSHRAIVRVDDNRVLGVVGHRYTPLQNHEAFAWLDGIVGKRQAIYETAGSLHGGKVVWMLVRLPNELRVDSTDDVSRPYVLLCNSHDGTQSLRVLNTVVRVVCNNTLTWALNRSAGGGLALRHTASIRERVEEARRVLGIVQQQQQHTQEQMNRLNRTSLTEKQVKSYFREIWPDQPDVEDNSRRELVRQQLLENFHAGPQQLPGIRGTAWAAFNAVSQYTDWQRPTRGRTEVHRDHNRLRSIWLGDSASVKRRAWNRALHLAAN